MSRARNVNEDPNEDPSEDRILREELTAVAVASGANRRLYEFMMTKFVGKLLKKHVQELDLVLPRHFDDAVRHVTDVLEEAGPMTEAAPVAAGGDRRVVRVVASGGVGAMNPVVVTAVLTRSPGSRTRVGLRAVAMEGPIKQRSAEKAAARIAALLNG
ncbi:hypothetical protein [Streptomyces sp. NPDC060198]|uniref:hypothetical protein n=1 Tax=Streptomyces sp. NPDC060198 TaxID=3347070 RepID=UPI0036567917